MHSEEIKTATVESGTIINQRYELLCLLGAGGMSEVYRARDLQIQRDVAFKLMHKHLAADQDAIKRFQREAVATSELKHPNIVDAFAFDIWQNRPYIVVELLHGTSLAEVLQKEKTLTRDRATHIFIQVLDALEYAHAHGVVHRDLKPANIMLVGPEQKVKVVDFGIAKILPQSGKDVQKLTQTGELFGTVLYMSPEQCLSVPLDGKSDIYSLGCVLYETLEGVPPLVASGSFATMAKQIAESPCDGKSIDHDMMDLIHQCMDKDPTKRPAASELKSVLVHGTRSRWARSSSGIKIAVGGTIFLCLAVLASLVYRFGDVKPKDRQGEQPRRQYTFPGVGGITSAAKQLKLNPVPFTSNRDVSLLGAAAISKDPLEQIALCKKFIAKYPVAPGVFDPDVVEAQRILSSAYLDAHQNQNATPILGQLIKQVRPFKDRKPELYHDVLFHWARQNDGNTEAAKRYYQELIDDCKNFLPFDKKYLYFAELDLAKLYLRSPADRAVAEKWLKKAEQDSRGADNERQMKIDIANVRSDAHLDQRTNSASMPADPARTLDKTPPRN